MKIVRVNKVARHSIKWLNWLLVIPFLVLLLLSSLLLYTPGGLRFASTVAQHSITGLSIGQTQGSLLGGHVIQDISLQLDGVNLTLREWRLRIDPRCLLSMQFCIENITFDGVAINIKTDTQQENDAPMTSAFVFPLPITIDQFTLNDFSASVNGNTLALDKFATSAHAWGNKLQLTKPQLQRLKLKLTQRAEATSASQPWQYNHPALSDFTAPLNVFINQLQLSDAEIQNVESIHRFESLQLSLHWQQQLIRINDLTLDSTDFTMHATANVHTEGAYALTASAKVQSKHKRLAGQNVNLELLGDLSNLTAKLNATGPLQASLTAKVNILNDALPHQLTLHVESADLAPMLTDLPYSITNSQLNLEGDLNASKLYAIVNAAADQAQHDIQANITGAVNLERAEIDMLKIHALDGTITSSATLDWQQGIRWQSESKVEHINLVSVLPEFPGRLSAELEHNGHVNSDGSWLLDISKLVLDGDIRSHQLHSSGSVSAHYTKEQGGLSLDIPNLVVKHATNKLDISGKLARQWQLRAQINAPNLQQSVPNIKGMLTGDFKVSGDLNTPEFSGLLHAESFRWQEVSVANAQFDANLWLNTMQKINGKLELHATNGRYNTQTFEQVTLLLTGSEQNHQLELSTTAQDHQIQMQLRGSLDEPRNIWRATLNSAQLTSMLGAWQLATPVAMSFQAKPQKLHIDSHCWLQQQARLCLSTPMLMSEEKTSLAVTLDNFNLATANTLLPANTALQGIVFASAELSMQQNVLPILQLRLEGENGKLTQQLQTELEIPWHKIRLSSELHADTLSNDIQLTLDDNASLTANIAVSALQQGDRNLSGFITLDQLAIDFLQPLLGEFSQFQGKLASEVQLSGTIAAPLLAGNIHLTQAKIKGKKAPTDIENADVIINFRGQEANLNGKVITPNGEITLSGSAAWPDLNNWQANVNLNGDALKLQVPNAHLQIAPDLRLKLTPTLTTLQGTVNIPLADINVDSLPQNAVELSDDLVLVDERLTPLPQTEPTIFNMETDIKVLLGERVKLSAFGLRTRLKGSLRVRQQPRQPLRLNGNVMLEDGTFRAYGQDLLIRKGKMSFNGPADQPFLTIEAIRNPENMEDDVIAGIRVDGPADSPTIVVFSEPAKAQANALSYLIMGRDLDSSSGTGGNALTTGLIGMTLASSSKVVGEIGEAFGLKELTLDTAGAGDNSQVTVSGYLSRDLQLKYGYGIFNAVGEFTLRYRVMRRLYLEAVSGVDNAVDLLYKFEFD